MYEINRKSWHYNFIYGSHWWRPGWEASQEPRDVDFCSHWKKVILFMALIPLWLLLFALALLCIGLWTGIAFFFGYWPNIGKYADPSPLSGPFHTEYKYDGKSYHRFAPWEIVLPLAAIVGIIYWGIRSLSTLTLVASWSGIIIGSIIMVSAIIFFLVKGWRSETFKSFRLWVKAKKMKVCPRAKFVG